MSGKKEFGNMRERKLGGKQRFHKKIVFSLEKYLILNDEILKVLYEFLCDIYQIANLFYLKMCLKKLAQNSTKKYVQRQDSCLTFRNFQ